MLTMNYRILDVMGDLVRRYALEYDSRVDLPAEVWECIYIMRDNMYNHDFITKMDSLKKLIVSKEACDEIDRLIKEVEGLKK